MAAIVATHAIVFAEIRNTFESTLRTGPAHENARARGGRNLTRAEEVHRRGRVCYRLSLRGPAICREALKPVAIWVAV